MFIVSFLSEHTLHSSYKHTRALLIIVSLIFDLKGLGFSVVLLVRIKQGFLFASSNQGFLLSYVKCGFLLVQINGGFYKASHWLLQKKKKASCWRITL